jgi:hypothetical protein
MKEKHRALILPLSSPPINASVEDTKGRGCFLYLERFWGIARSHFLALLRLGQPLPKPGKPVFLAMSKACFSAFDYLHSSEVYQGVLAGVRAVTVKKEASEAPGRQGQWP